MKWRNHGHVHHDMKAVLRSYGADAVPDAPHQRWRDMKCPFHEDRSASSQTDGVGFRCFTCDVFYPAPMFLIQGREGGTVDDAHGRYHDVAGSGDEPVRGSGQRGFPVSGSTRHRPRSRRGGTTRGRF